MEQDGAGEVDSVSLILLIRKLTQPFLQRRISLTCSKLSDLLPSSLNFGVKLFLMLIVISKRRVNLRPPFDILILPLPRQPQTAKYLIEGGFVSFGFILRRDGDDVKHPSVGSDCRICRIDLDDAADR